MSQLTVDSQQIDTDENDKLSQESRKKTIVQPTTEMMNGYPSTQIDTTNGIRSTEVIECDMYDSMNDTPGKDVSNQVDSYNEKMNTSFQNTMILRDKIS